MEKKEIAFPMEKKELLLAWQGIMCPVFVPRFTKTSVYWSWKRTGEQENKDAAVEVIAVFLLLLQGKTLRRGEGPFASLLCQVYQADDCTALLLIL